MTFTWPFTTRAGVIITPNFIISLGDYKRFGTKK
jgi:hypothetical protein